MEKVEVKGEIGGRELKLTAGNLAAQANGAVTCQYGDTVVLATAVMSDEVMEGFDYMPLLVDYEEKLYAAGKIKGSRFVKREGRPSDEAFLKARLIDRSIRPLFNENIRNDMQVVVTILSYDGENEPDVLAVTAAAAALTISDIPVSGSIAAVRVGRINGELVLNTTETARPKSELDLVVTGSKDRVVMIEAGAKEVPDDDMAEAVNFGHKHVGKILQLVEKLASKTSQEKRPEPEVAEDEALRREVGEYCAKQLAKDLKTPGKVARNEKTKALMDKFIEEKLKTQYNVDDFKQNKELEEKKTEAHRYFEDLIKDEVRRGIMEEGVRLDGRKLDEIRPLSIEVSQLPRTHGSGLFQRGETQVLTVATLGGPGSEQIMEGLEDETKKRYIHHYNFPPFSVGETAPSRWPSRREVGHGALAERALEPVLPDKEKFPYTIRLVSEVLAANGSTSMASTCGSTLALMDAGVPISRPVGGVAMGLVTDETENYKILTDLQGEEDHVGDMDFKVTGTEKGITALQLDVKCSGLTPQMLEDALKQAKQGRKNIIDAICKVIPEPRKDLSKYAPRVETMHIDPDKIRDVIGPGGKMINQIIEETGSDIDIEDDGSVFVTSTDAEGMKKALDWINDLTREVEVGEKFRGKITRLTDFGAFVQILPGKEGMVHISQFSDQHLNRIEDVANIGDELDVVVIEIDELGRINLSHKAAVQPGRDIVSQKYGKDGPPQSSGDGNSDRRSNDRPRRGTRPGGGGGRRR